MDYDRILQELGEFGTWQRINAGMLWIPSIVAGMNIMVAAFAVMEPRNGFRCRIQECDQHMETHTFSNYPKEDMFPSFDNKSTKYDPENPDYCHYYKPSWREGKCHFDKSSTGLCNADSTYIYAPFEMESSVATENNLVCDRYVWIPIIDSFMMFGLLVGSFIFGVLSDKIGRRHTLLIGILCCSLGNLIGAFMPNQWSYAILRIFGGAGGEGVFVLAFTMSLEYSGVAERVPGLPWVTYSTLLANLISIPFAVGEFIPVLFAMGLTKWTTYQIVVSCVMGLACLTWLLLPESPRWLIANGKDERARAVVEKAAKRNGVKLSTQAFQPPPGNKEVELDLPVYSLKDMFRSSQLKITIIFFICWPVVTLLYYGLTLSADKIKISENVYIASISVAAIEIPAYLMLPLIIDIWGRKPLFAFCQLVPGILCIVAAFLKPGTLLFAILALGAKLGSAMAFNCTFMYTAQLYPTTIRNSAVGTCSTIARLGGLMAPWVGKYLTNPVAFSDPIPEFVPLVLFGGFGVLGGLCALLLPEPLGFPLPNTFEDVENIKKGSKPIWKCGTVQK